VVVPAALKTERGKRLTREAGRDDVRPEGVTLISILDRPSQLQRRVIRYKKFTSYLVNL
jgi:hypothetical protein